MAMLAILTFVGMSSSFAQGYNVSLAQQCNPTTGGTETLSFTGTLPNANGAGTLTIVYFNGDLNSSGETINFNGETGASLGISNLIGQCTAVADSLVVSIPMATINAWAATGSQIDISCVSSTSVNNICSSNSFCVIGRLSYPFATGPNDAGASNVTPTIVCPGTDTVKVQVNNYGTNQIDSVWLNWSKNGTLQTPIQITSLLDTAGGTGVSNISVSLGVHTFTAGVTDVYKAWTSMPNGTADTTVLNDTVSSGIKPALTGVFTIGGTSPDYSTFAAAIADLNAIGLCGPVTFNVRQGTYVEQVAVDSYTGVSAVNNITFQSDPANTAMPVIQFNSTVFADNYTLRFNGGAKYITFDSLNFKTLGTSYNRVVDIPSATENMTIKNCVLDGYATATTSSYSAIIYQTGGVQKNLTIEDNKLNNGSYGMYIRGTSTAASGRSINTVIRGNELVDQFYYMTYFYYQNGLVVEGNSLKQRTTATSIAYGMFAYYCDSAKIRSNNIELYGTSTTYGILLGYSYGGATNKIEITNNMISTSPNSSNVYGLYANYLRHANVYHNTVNVRSCPATTIRALYIYGSSGYGPLDVRNNIVTNENSIGDVLYVSSGAASTYLSHLDNNIYHAPGTGSFFYGSSTYTSFAAYQTASLKDSNSQYAYPGYLSSTNLHLQGAVAADSGANVGVMVDIDGDARPILPSTGYDIGADEYIPPTCPSGYSLSAYNITATTADLGFIAGAADTGWLFEYGAPGFTPGTGTVSQSSNDSTTISGLTPITNYEGYVRGICSLGDTSIYVGPVAFKTRCVSSLSGTYTINSTLPTAGTNYASFADLMIALNNCGVSGPTVFNVKQGTYTEQVDMGLIVGVSAVNTITIQGDPTNTTAAILTYASSTAADNFVIKFDGAEHVIINDLTVTAAGTSYAYVIYFPTTANNITVKNCDLNGNTSATTSSLSTVVYNQSGSTNLIEDVTIDSNNINDGSYAMYMWGGGTTTKEKGLNIRNNNISGFNYYGIYLYYQDSITFDNNVVTQSPTSTSFCYGIYSYYLDNAKIRGNKITLNTTSSNYAIMIGRYNGLDNEISNNMIVTSANSCATCAAYGLYINYPKNTRIYHNSVNIRGGSATNTRALYATGSTSTAYGNVDIRNNIFSNDAGGYAAYFTTGASSSFLSDLDNNIYFSPGANVMNYNNINYSSLATYQAASLRDSNSYFSTPQYLAPDDLHVVGVVAYDNGDSTLGIMTDIDGDARPLAPSAGYDIGADEFIPPSCPSPYSMVLDTVLTTSATISWTNGPADSIWELQYGAPGFTLGTGTTVNSTTNPVVITGLTHSTCYEVWIRSVCTVGDTSLWSGPFNFCSKCAPVADYCTGFETDAYGDIPFCWNSFISSTSSYPYIRTNTYSAYSGTNCVQMYNSNDASATMMLIAPEVSNLASGTHRANFWMRADTTVIVGTMSDPSNPGTFVSWDTLQGLDRNTYQNYKVAFDTYTGTDTYVAFLFTPHTTYDYVYLDDYCWEAIPSCEKAPAVTILNSGVDSTSINVGWNFDTTHVSYIVAYGPAGYDPVTATAGGDSVYTTTNFANVGGLNPLTEYCFWVKAVCTNGDTSFWDGPHCGETGCPSSAKLPYFNDFSAYKYVSGIGEQLPLCWEEGKGLLTASGSIAIGTSNWTYDGFGNVGSDGSAKMNIYSTNRYEWFVSPAFDLGADSNTHRYIEFDIAMTDYANTSAGVVGDDDTLAFVVSYDAGVTWKKADILMQWDTGNVPSNTGDHIVYILKKTVGVVKFGFYAASSVSNEDNDWFIDNFSIRDTVFAGIEEVNFNENFKVFPNPNNGVFTLLNEGNAQESNIKLMDIQGRVVYDNKFFFTRNGSKQIKVNNLNSGVYILLLQSEGKLEQHRIVIE